MNWSVVTSNNLWFHSAFEPFDEHVHAELSPWNASRKTIYEYRVTYNSRITRSPFTNTLKGRFFGLEIRTTLYREYVRTYEYETTFPSKFRILWQVQRNGVEDLVHGLHELELATSKVQNGLPQINL
jgi:hypothetical protein